MNYGEPIQTALAERFTRALREYEFKPTFETARELSRARQAYESERCSLQPHPRQTALFAAAEIPEIQIKDHPDYPGGQVALF